MPKPSLIHLEHALPPLAELGLERLASALTGAGRVVFTSEDLREILQGLAGGAQKHAARRLVMVAKSSATDLLAMELDTKAEADALRDAALLPYDEAGEAIADFFASFGLSLKASLGSSENLGEAPESPGPGADPSATDIS